MLIHVHQRLPKFRWVLRWVVVVTDENEAKLPIPKKYGIDEFPVILQDRTFHEHNQLDYRAEYNQMGIFGDTPMINGVVGPYLVVTKQKVRLLFLCGYNTQNGVCTLMTI